MIIILCLTLIIICVLLEAFFAGTEMAIVSSNKFKIKYLAEKGNKNASRLLKLFSKTQLFFATTLLGGNIVVIIGSSIATSLISMFIPSEFVSLAATFVMLPFILLFGEIIPMSLGRLHSTRLSILMITPLYLAHYILFPLVKLFSKLSEKIVGLFGVHINENDAYISKDELLYILEHETSQSSLLPAEDNSMIKQIFSFHGVLAKDIMVLMDDVVSVESSTSCREVIKLMYITGYSRLPVYNENRHNIVGITKTTELIQADLDKPIKKYMIKPYRSPENTPVIEILWELQQSGRQMVIISGNDNKSIGIVTLEDIIEKVVGSITDEYDEETQQTK